jgi:hypothetical protein
VGHEGEGGAFIFCDDFSQMEENTVLYIRYKAHNPVAIHTSYGRGPQKTLPLETVADLIEAVKEKFTPRFDSTPVTLLTIYRREENGEETRLAVDLQLAELGNAGRTVKTALIVEKSIKIYSSWGLYNPSLRANRQKYRKWTNVSLEIFFLKHFMSK